MTRVVKTIVLVAAATSLFVLAFAAGPASAAKPKPCWQRLIDDWYDGRIDGIYSFKCYREAKKHAPEDLIGYSDLPTDLDRALSSMQRVKRANGDVLLAPGAAGHDNQRRKESKESKPSRTDDNDPDRTLAIGPGVPKGPIPKVIQAAGPDADQVPLPLIALGALALLLIAAGAAGFVTKRLRTRRLSAEPPAPGA